MKEIICSPNLFSIQTPIILFDTETQEIHYIGTTSLSNNIWQDLYDVCESQGVYDLKLYGSKDILEEIVTNIKKIEKLKYGQNKINIGVFEK